MIILIYSNPTSKVTEWADRLKQLAVSFQLKEDKKIGTPCLLEGKKQIAGETEIDHFLEKLEVDVREWCKCVCD